MLKRSGDILKALQETYDFIIDRTVMRKMGNVVSFYHLCFKCDIDFTA